MAERLDVRGPDLLQVAEPSTMFFLGHSHIGALFQGGEAHGRIIDSLNLWAFGRPVIYGEDGHRLEPSLEALLGTTVVSAVGGSAHDMVGLVQHPRAFDFVLPEAPDLPVIPGAEIIPHAAVARTVRAMVEDEQLDLIRLLPAPGRRALHLESPPPVEDDAKLGREMGYLGFVPADAHQPSPAWLRYKLWRVHSALVREVCAGCGMEFVPFPPQASADGYFLRPELQGGPCHGNGGYGELVLRQIGYLA